MFVSVGGPTGATGAAGADGATGATGATGPQGPAGTGNASMKTGTYTGDGSDNRSIDIGIDLTSKTYAFVLIKGNIAQAPVSRIEYGQGDLSMYMQASVDSANIIQSFTETGFQLGSASTVNTNAILYRYIAFWVD